MADEPKQGYDRRRRLDKQPAAPIRIAEQDEQVPPPPEPADMIPPPAPADANVATNDAESKRAAMAAEIVENERQQAASATKDLVGHRRMPIPNTFNFYRRADVSSTVNYNGYSSGGTFQTNIVGRNGPLYTREPKPYNAGQGPAPRIYPSLLDFSPEAMFAIFLHDNTSKDPAGEDPDMVRRSREIKQDLAPSYPGKEENMLRPVTTTSALVQKYKAQLGADMAQGMSPRQATLKGLDQIFTNYSRAKGPNDEQLLSLAAGNPRSTHRSRGPMDTDYDGNFNALKLYYESYMRNKGQSVGGGRHVEDYLAPELDANSIRSMLNGPEASVVRTTNEESIAAAKKAVEMLDYAIPKIQRDAANGNSHSLVPVHTLELLRDDIQGDLRRGQPAVLHNDGLLKGDYQTAVLPIVGLNPSLPLGTQPLSPPLGSITARDGSTLSSNEVAHAYQNVAQAMKVSGFNIHTRQIEHDFTRPEKVTVQLAKDIETVALGELQKVGVTPYAAGDPNAPRSNGRR